MKNFCGNQNFNDPEVRNGIKVHAIALKHIGFIKNWKEKNQESASLDAKIQEDPHLKNKGTIIQGYC